MVDAELSFAHFTPAFFAALANALPPWRVGSRFSPAHFFPVQVPCTPVCNPADRTDDFFIDLVFVCLDLSQSHTEPSLISPLLIRHSTSWILLENVGPPSFLNDFSKPPALTRRNTNQKKDRSSLSQNHFYLASACGAFI